MNPLERDESLQQQLDEAVSLLGGEVSDDALEALAGSILMSGSSYPGVNCTGGCKR